MEPGEYTVSWYQVCINRVVLHRYCVPIWEAVFPKKRFYRCLFLARIDKKSRTISSFGQLREVNLKRQRLSFGIYFFILWRGRRWMSCCSRSCRDLSGPCCSLSRLYSWKVQLKCRRVVQKEHLFWGTKSFLEVNHFKEALYVSLSALVSLTSWGLVRLDSCSVFQPQRSWDSVKRLNMTEKGWQNPLLLERTDFNLRIAENQDEKFLGKEADERKKWD